MMRHVAAAEAAAAVRPVVDLARVERLSFAFRLAEGANPRDASARMANREQTRDQGQNAASLTRHSISLPSPL
jgi:DNA-binding helix-hairpin-helix protein with protein kinase domain